MIKSEQINELTKALIAFQSEMKSVSFDADNPFFKSKYATLTNIVDSSKELLAKNGLAVTQLTTGDGGVTTILMHTSGQFIGDTLTLKAVKDDPQGHGSAITYARRYAYASILGIVSDADDDGNEASQPKSQQKTTASTSPRPAVAKANGNGEHKEGGMLTLKDMVIKMGFEKFGSADAFQIWRVENNFPDNLETAKQMDLAKIMTLLREVKPIGAK